MKCNKCLLYLSLASNMEPVLAAFLLTLAAGGATGIGALLPFALKDTNSNMTLGICLGLSAGVMIYVSFTEIYKESIEMFSRLHTSKEYPVLFATAAFFVGVLLCILLDVIVHWMLGEDHHEHSSSEDFKILEETPRKNSNRVAKTKARQRITAQSTVKSEPVKSQSEEERKAHNLTKMSAMSALAIALHNLPEGMATFFATLSNPKLGASLAVAIAIHNIPEGIAVALPVYYATNSKLKSFLIGFLSGMTEPLGGLIAYYIVKHFSASDDVTESVAFAFMFSLVAGMMVYISIVEL